MTAGLPPYHADPDGRFVIYCADALDLLRSVPDASVDLVLTDPPYFGVKEDAWDNAWKNEYAFLRWIGALCCEWRRVLKPNGSLYVFASPQMAHGVERVIRRYFNLLNGIRWEKDAGWHQKQDKETLRSYLSPWEAVFFAEQVTGDSFAADLTGYYTETTLLRRRIYAPLGEYFKELRDGSGLSRNEIEVALGFTSGNDPSRGTALYTRWEEASSLPTAKTYERLQALVGHTVSFTPYQELRRLFDVELREKFERDREAYEHLREAYEHLRRPFTPGENWSDIWRYPTVSWYPGKHVCEKPLEMAEDIIRTSSRPGGVVLETFVGSGAFAEAALNLGRIAIVGDADPHWCRKTHERLVPVHMGFGL